MADALWLVTKEGTFELPGMPPGRGTEVIPHPATFLQLLPGGPSRVYRPSDEAIRQSRAHARFMRLDATVMECVELRQRATALLDWHIEVEDKNLKPIADELTRILRRIPRFVQYRDTLLSAIWYGRYAIENLYTWDWIDGKKRVVIDGWVPIHGDKLVWKIDSETGRIDSERWGIRIGTLSGASPRLRDWFEENRQYIEPTDWGLAYFPPPGKRELVVIHRHIVEDGEFEEGQSADRVFGVGIRSRIYWIWYQKQEALRWLMEFLERSAFGIELWYYPAGNLEAREHMLQAASQRVGTGRNILLVPRPPGPEGAVYGVERIEPSMAGAQALKEILTDYFGHQIKRYILGQTLTTEAHATGLGSNLASIHLDTFLQIVKYDAANLQETLTDQLVRRLVEWNWPGVDSRLFRFVIEVEKPDVAERLQALRQAFDMGLKLKAADVRDLLGIAAPGADDETLQNPSYARGPEMPGMQPKGMPMGIYASGLPREPLAAYYVQRYSRPEHYVGEIKVEDGVTYRLNENHRWERVDERENGADSEATGARGAGSVSEFGPAAHRTASGHAYGYALSDANRGGSWTDDDWTRYENVVRGGGTAVEYLASRAKAYRLTPEQAAELGFVDRPEELSRTAAFYVPGRHTFVFVHRADEPTIRHEIGHAISHLLSEETWREYARRFYDEGKALWQKLKDYQSTLPEDQAAALNEELRRIRISSTASWWYAYALALGEYPELAKALEALKVPYPHATIHPIKLLIACKRNPWSRRARVVISEAISHYCEASPDWLGEVASRLYAPPRPDWVVYPVEIGPDHYVLVHRSGQIVDRIWEYRYETNRRTTFTLADAINLGRVDDSHLALRPMPPRWKRQYRPLWLGHAEGGAKRRRKRGDNRERYSQEEEGPRVGDIKYENGVPYRFNENHRWERVDEPGGTEGVSGASGLGGQVRPGPGQEVSGTGRKASPLNPASYVPRTPEHYREPEFAGNWPEAKRNEVQKLIDGLGPHGRAVAGHAPFTCITNDQIRSMPYELQGRVYDAGAICWNRNRICIIERNRVRDVEIRHELLHYWYNHLPNAALRPVHEYIVSVGERLIETAKARKPPQGVDADTWKSFRKAIKSAVETGSDQDIRDSSVEISLMLPSYSIASVAKALGIPGSDQAQWLQLSVIIAAAKRAGTLEKLSPTYAYEEPIAYLCGADPEIFESLMSYVYLPPPNSRGYELRYRRKTPYDPEDIQIFKGNDWYLGFGDKRLDNLSHEEAVRYVDMFNRGEAEPSLYPKYADWRIRERYRAPKELQGVSGREGEIRRVGNTEYIWAKDRAGRHQWLIYQRLEESKRPGQAKGREQTGYVSWAVEQPDTFTQALEMVRSRRHKAFRAKCEKILGILMPSAKKKPADMVTDAIGLYGKPEPTVVVDLTGETEQRALAALSAMALLSIAPQKQVALFKPFDEGRPAKIVITFKEKPEDLYEATKLLFEALNLELPGATFYLGAEPKVEIGADPEAIDRIALALDEYVRSIQKAGGTVPVSYEVAKGEFSFHPAEPEGPLPPEDDPRELAYRLDSARQYIKTIVKATTAFARQRLFQFLHESLLENREAARRANDSKLVALIDAVLEEVRKFKGKS